LAHWGLGKPYGRWEEEFGAEHTIRLWTVERKYRRQPMTLREIEKAIAAAQTFQQAEYDWEKRVNVQVWVVSTRGIYGERFSIPAPKRNLLFGV
jgi:hypothetical protein